MMTMRIQTVLLQLRIVARLSFGLLAAAGLGMLFAASSGDSVAADLLSPSQAARLGLVESWRRQMQVPAGAQSIVDQQLYVIKGTQLEFVEVTHAAKSLDVKPKLATANASGSAGEQTSEFPGVQGESPEGVKVFARFRVDDFGAKNSSIGKVEAERRARQQVRILERRGIAATITTRTAPAVRLYTLGDDGTLQCQDAENGELIWLARFGNRHRGYGKLGISDKEISIVNGSDLILVDAANGEEINIQSMFSVPLFGAVHGGDYSLIPTIRGGIETYPLKDTTIDPFMEIVGGQALAMPTVAPGSDKVAWGTDNGFVYVMELSGTPSTLFRLDTDGIVSGKVAAASGERFFFGSEGGQVYAVRATRTGEMIWSRPFGEPFYNEPLVYGDKMLIRSTYGSMYSLNIDNGDLLWIGPSPGVDELIACFDNQIYVRMLSGVMAVLDIETGKFIEMIASIQPQKILSNFQTNRLYLVDASGLVQCLKPIDSDLPVVSEVMRVAVTEKVDEDAKATKGEEAMETDKSPDPFGAGAADPFGASKPDPFGAGAADPFGGGDAMDAGAVPGAAADPFGGSDPFGN